MKSMLKHFVRRGETGQSIIILALAFVMLIGFVGIVTDLSLMLVRYSSLRRAVDSASIAAATQMRDDRDMATVSLTARQFIEFHGLNPRRVVVETCANSPLPDGDGDGYPDDPELCTADQRKLVRVTAQVESPTVFLRLLGWGNITLEAAAISETAVLDVVIIMDVSESMLNETTYEDWARINLGRVYAPPNWRDIDDAKGVDYITLWQTMLLNTSQENVNQRLYYSDDPGSFNTGADTDYPVAVLPATTACPAGSGWDCEGSNFQAEYGDQYHAREECTVRFWPYSLAFSVPAELQTMYGASWTGGSTWRGFVPTYDFYGCCNDPTSGGITDPDTGAVVPGAFFPGDASYPGGDNDFSDLICQPFKQAKDATRQFLDRVDFLRGDRVAFVTFDRSAYIINPYNTGAIAAGGTHMIDNLADARIALDRYLGVRTEPNFYRWNPADPGGEIYATGWDAFANGVDEFGDSEVIDYSDASATDLNAYPVRSSCPYQNAGLPYPFSRYATISTQPDSGESALLSIMHPNRGDAAWDYNPYNLSWGGDPPGLRDLNSYELWASCRGTNIGAAIREGGNALLNQNTTRRTGTVWVMVMLSDGAAGASDPVRRNQVDIDPRPEKLLVPQPYANIQDDYLPGPPASGARRYGIAGDYGVFGVCPVGTRTSPGELADTFSPRENPIVFPFCSDEDPESRHMIPTEPTSPGCSFAPSRQDEDYDSTENLDVNSRLGNVYDVRIGGDFPNNECQYYDVDDYARDWADFIGLMDDAGGADVQLPTIFTIGFGLTFDQAGGTCEENVPDCLGEELLRYIADVGDNFHIDADYQQWYRGGNTVSFDLPAGQEFGPRGPCEGPGAGHVAGVYADFASMIDRLTPTANCGNYFNAPSQAELEEVFDEIASRMFTRLAE